MPEGSDPQAVDGDAYWLGFAPPVQGLVRHVLGMMHVNE